MFSGAKGKTLEVSGGYVRVDGQVEGGAQLLSSLLPRSSEEYMPVSMIWYCKQTTGTSRQALCCWKVRKGTGRTHRRRGSLWTTGEYRPQDMACAGRSHEPSDVRWHLLTESWKSQMSGAGCTVPGVCIKMILPVSSDDEYRLEHQCMRMRCHR